MELPLGKGKFALIDDADWEKVQHLPWRLHRGSHSGPYAIANVLLHRYLLDFPDGQVDHKDHDGLNCSRSNLRVVTHRQNIWNRGYHKRDMLSSPFWGVFWDARPGVWRARIRHEGKDYYLGRFATGEEAARAYNLKCLELRGEYAVLNEIPEDD